MAGDTTEELERFRQQWQQEFTARSKGAGSASRPAVTVRKSSGAGHSRAAPPPLPKPPGDPRGTVEDDEERGYHDLEDKDVARRLGDAGEGVHPSSRQEPSSALEHYERAVERESEGSLGDSLSHYRKAFRLDAGVDRAYKNKHFPPSDFKSKPANPNPSNASVTVPNTAHHSLDGHPPKSSISQLIASFCDLPIPAEAPPTELSPAPPCPVSRIPSELLIQILLQTAITDIASFASLSLVSKRLAFLIATEDRIWRRICHGPEVGFKAMHYAWACSISGGPLPTSISDLDSTLETLTLTLPPSPSLPLTPTHPTYRHMFQTRPRLRFNGCYISTVNYIRPGAATASQATWNSPVLIVTYYRYLRFFRDGRCASLLTTTEPADVVHHLTAENLHSRHAGGLPSAVMNHALRGRWKLSGDPYSTNVSAAEEAAEPEGTIYIETEGADADKPNPKYMYRLMLQLKSTGSGQGKTRNNKLAWCGYWSYNKMTDDWAEFALRNDRPFFWSRVRSYGHGE